MGKRKTDELVEALTNKKSKTKKGDNKVKTIIITVAVTLAVVAAFTATFFAGVNHEANKQNEINARIDSAVQEATVVIKGSEKASK